MRRPEPDSPAARARAQAAAEWIVKRDRGLAAAEQDEFLQWLAADPRHGEWLALHRHTVGDFNCLAQWRPEHSDEPNPDLLARPRRRVRWLAPMAFAAAAGIAVVISWWLPAVTTSDKNRTPIGGYELRALEDGSTVELNRGAKISVAFTRDERRVTLTQGEALFTVAKNPRRPFVVGVGGVAVRAVGTAFNVRLDAGAVDVLVTEGRVQIEPPARAAAVEIEPPPLLEARHRAVVSLTGAAPPQIAPVPLEETVRLRAWQPQLLDFSSVPLRRVIAEFNRRNRIQLRLGDDALGGLPIVASIRSDNIDGLVHFLEINAGLRADPREGEIVLLRK